MKSTRTGRTSNVVPSLFYGVREDVLMPTKYPVGAEYFTNKPERPQDISKLDKTAWNVVQLKVLLDKKGKEETRFYVS